MHYSCTKLVRFPALSAALLALLLALLTGLTGCGGGGGGGGGGTSGSGKVTLTGTLLDVTTGLAPSSGTISVNGHSTSMKSDGTFTLTGVAPTATSATITASGEQTQTLALVIPASAVTTATTVALGIVYLSPTGYTAAASGTVVTGTTTKPVPGASVTIAGSTVTTDANGNFTISNLPAGLGTDAGAPIGSVTAAGYENQPIYSPYVFEASTTTTLGNIVIEPGSSVTTPTLPYTVTGKVTAGGSPKQGATVELIIPATATTTAQTITTTTDVNGNYYFWVVPGTYTIAVLGSSAQQIFPSPSTITETSTALIVTVPTIVYQ